MNKLCNIIFDKFNQSGYECYLVGGAVRDFLMKVVEPKDYDFATNARPEEILNLVGGKKVGFATILVEIAGKKVEISTYRKKEQYFADSRTPIVEFGDIIEEDLGRRDFTINAMAMGLGGLIDPCSSGRRDVNNKIIRLTNDDESVLTDDPLRMLRAIRFVSKLGFDIDSTLGEKIWSNAESILYISRERWLMEMDKILMGKHVRKALEYLNKDMLATYMIPEINATINLHQGNAGYHHKNVWEHIKMVIEKCPENKNLRWAALLHDLGKGNTRSLDEDNKIHFYKHELVSTKLANDICDRFKISNKDRKEIIFLVANHMKIMTYTDKWKDSAVRRFVINAGEYLGNLLALARADITSMNPKVIKMCLDNVQSLEDRIAKLKAEKKAEPRLISREKFKELVEFSELRDTDIGLMKMIVEQGIADGEIEEDFLVEDLYNYCEERIEIRRI